MQKLKIKKLDSLLNKTLHAFIETGKIEKIYLFGSISENNYDNYSDLDLSILTSDYNYFSKNLKKTLDLIGTPLTIFPAVNDPGNSVLTILWNDFPLYQKLDLRIHDKNDKEMNKNNLIYEIKKTSKHLEKSTRIPLDEMMFTEELRSFYDFYIGATRYIKHRKRKQFLSAYKFYRSTFENFLKLKFFDIEQRKYSSRSMTTVDFKIVDEKVSKFESEELSRYLIIKNSRQIDELFFDLISTYLDISIKFFFIKRKSKDYKFAKKVVEFAHDELLSKRKKYNSFANTHK